MSERENESETFREREFSMSSAFKLLSDVCLLHLSVCSFSKKFIFMLY